MRVPTSEAPRRSLGIRAWIVGAAIVLVVLLASVRGFARFYTEYLWFEELGFGDVWGGLLGARIAPAVVFSAAFFVLLLANLIIADRLAPKHRAMGPEDEAIEKYRTYVAPYSGRLRVAVALFFAVVMGSGVASEWRSWILFRNSVEFGIDDPQFGRDIGFYVFELPFLRFAASWLFAALLVVFVVTIVFHYVNGGIRIQSPFQRVTPQVKAHLSVILALMAVTKTAQYYLGRFQLNFSRRGAIDGASYTDVKAQLPALNFLMIISVAAAILFIANIWRRGWVLPVIAVGLWAFISVVVGTIYPAYIQRFQVKPNEFAREEPYLERNIEATRAAFGLDEVEERSFDYTEDLDEEAVLATIASFDNARLWDPDELRKAFRATQEIETYFAFEDVDVDRYRIGGEMVPVFVSARELSESELPSRTFTNERLRFTHGYGAVAAAANEVRADFPSYLLSDIPVEGSLALERPELYYGEKLGGFAVADTKQAEYNAVDDARTDDDTSGGAGEGAGYQGKGGVAASNFLRRASLALRFGSWDLMVSSQLTSESRVLFRRDIADRVRSAAPFLEFDADPYPVVLDDKIVWVVDGYTTSSNYPYAQALRPRNLPAGSDLDDELNYIRNSVKATVDAYDGTVTFFVVDEEDPMIRAWQKAFPDLFTDQDEIPDGLREHFRYPEDMFRAQTEAYTAYHVDDAQRFYSGQDLWDVSSRPEVVEATGLTSTTVRPSGSDGGRNVRRSGTTTPTDPLYVMLQLPGEDDAEFVLTRPFVPLDRQNQLTGYIVARSDPEHYGQLVVYSTPDTVRAPSPTRAATIIETTTAISEQFTLLSRAGSEVLRGDLQLIPVDNGIVYLRPILVQRPSADAFPVFRFVAASFGERAVLAPSVDCALQSLRLVSRSETYARDCVVETDLGDDPVTEPPGEGEPPGEEPPPGEPVPDEIAALVAAAERELADAQEALDAGRLGDYQESVEAAREFIARLQELIDAETEPAPTTTVPPDEA